MKSKYLYTLSAILGISISISLTACKNTGNRVQNQATPGTNQQIRFTPDGSYPNASPGTRPGVGNIIGENNGSSLGNRTPGINTPTTGQPTPTPLPVGFDMQKADRLAKQMGSIDGAGQTNVIVHGNTALVGYTPTGTSKDANTVKSNIINKIKQADNTITNIVVSDSASMANTINQLSNDIKSGKTSADQTNKFNEIVRSLGSTITPVR